jgi:hypothetical protein
MWIASHVNAQLSLVNAAGRMIDGIRGRICFTTGPTLRLYKLHPPGTPTGFSQPFASSEEPGSPALAAFDGEPSLWRPVKGQARDAFVGFDFGHRGDKEFTKVRIDWGGAPPYGLAVEFQYADFGGEWRSAGVFRVRARVSGAETFSEHRLPEGLGAHRLWRMQIRGAAPDASIAVREVRFLADRGDAAVSAGAGLQQASAGAPSRLEADDSDAPSLTQRLLAGAPAKLVFDEAACKRHNLGTLRCGSEYEARYDAPSNRWTVTGYSNDHRKIVTFSTGNAEPRPGLISVWGIINGYNDDGALFYFGDKIGTIEAK